MITKKTKQLLTIISIMMCFLMVGVSKSQAQEKYSFATWSNVGNSQNEDYIYLYISDPVKNWYTLSGDKQKDWKTNFKTSGNSQAGGQYMKSFSDPVPDGGSYERYTSLADCRAGIEAKITKFKSDNNGSKPVKVIYINLRLY